MRKILIVLFILSIISVWATSVSAVTSVSSYYGLALISSNNTEATDALFINNPALEQVHKDIFWNNYTKDLDRDSLHNSLKWQFPGQSAVVAGLTATSFEQPICAGGEVIGINVFGREEATGAIPSIKLTKIEDNLFEVDINGKKMPLHVDPPECLGEEEGMSEAEFLATIKKTIEKTYTRSWVYIYYDRFDLYIDSDFYAQHTPRIDDFFNKFEPRFEQMENLTNWSAEKINPSKNKMKMYVDSTTSCWWGYAIPEIGESYVHLYENFSYQTESDICKRPYYLNGEEYYNNAGELGDWWIYMTGPIHESNHIITPLPIGYRTWLSEGWATYYEFNILSLFNDINQETANTYIYSQAHGGYNWPNYLANDYKDYFNYAIQNSGGYYISSWMLSMLRDDYDLNWSEFYNLINNNLETLDRSCVIGGSSYYSIYTDTYIIDILGRACGLSFAQIQAIFRYDGPSGPGWGVREWTDRDWYADLTPELSFSNDFPLHEETIEVIAAIYNSGGVSLKGVSVRFYDGVSLIDQQTADVNAGGSTIVSTFITRPAGTYNIRVAVDEDNIKIETDDLNNEDIQQIEFSHFCGDVTGDNLVNILDIVYLINYKYKGGPAPDPMEAADVNHDTRVDILDIVYLINYKYKGGPRASMPVNAE